MKSSVMSKKAPKSEGEVNLATKPSKPSQTRFSKIKISPMIYKFWLMQSKPKSPMEKPYIVILFAEIFLETNSLANGSKVFSVATIKCLSNIINKPAPNSHNIILRK